MIEYIFAIIILICAIPAGYFLKYFTKEEIKSGKRYFKIIWVSALILAAIAIFFNVSAELKKTIIFSLLFIAIVAFINWK